jgi:hypothetical protein
MPTKTTAGSTHDRSAFKSGLSYWPSKSTPFACSSGTSWSSGTRTVMKFFGWPPSSGLSTPRMRLSEMSTFSTRPCSMSVLNSEYGSCFACGVRIDCSQTRARAARTK